MAVADYDDRVVRAVKEAADALTRVDMAHKDLAAQRTIADGLSEVRRLDRVRVESGLETRLSIVESELRLLDAQIDVANLEADSAIARIQLLIAVGGDFAAATQNQPQ